MLGATAAIVRLARPRGVAALSTIATTPASCSLSTLFGSQCSLAKNSGPPRCITTVSTSCRGGDRRPRTTQLGHGSRAFSSKEGGNENPPASDEELPDTVSGSSQHDTWVQFQRSIAVGGFDTGQTVKEKTLDKKNRGGAIARKRKEREAEALAALKGVDTTQLKGGEFPALRYSDEETERLLAEAYAAIPPRAGKRGTLNLKRQKRRWWIKRQYDYRKKREMAAAAERKQEKKARIRGEIVATREGAAEIRDRDAAYHNRVLQRWAEENGHNSGLRELEGSRKKELQALGWNVGEMVPEQSSATV
ncbi:hypothetical protein ACHAXT_007183 [Thalassiosira profunda]